MQPPAHIAENWITVRERIAAAAKRCGRAPEDICLVAVTKTFGVDVVRAAAAAGLHDLGENKVQEGAQKKAALAGQPLCWHLIGHLQSNKARRAAATFDWIHSVDSVALLRRLDEAAAGRERMLNLLVQVDLAGESNKHGAPVSELERIVDAAAGCRFVGIRGLMVLPPWSDDPEQARPYFRRLRQLRDDLRASGPKGAPLDHLSMGMSHDLEVAVEEGATVVRIGTALFGPRPRPTPASR